MYWRESLIWYKTFTQIRKNGILAEIDYNNRNLKSQMHTANDLGVKYAIIIGENELTKILF